MLKYFGRLLKLQSNNPGKHCKQNFFFATHLFFNAFFLHKPNGEHSDSITYENLRDLTGNIRHECRKVLLHVQSCTIWVNIFRTNSTKFDFSLSSNQKNLAGLSNCLLHIQRSFWRKKAETTKKNSFDFEW